MGRHDTDWEAVEREYRAGIRSLRDIGGEFGCSEAAIRKRAKAQNWERDLTARIDAKTEALVRKAEAVRTKVRSARELADDDVIVEANAQSRAEAIVSQTQDARRGRVVVQKMIDEIEGQIDGREYLDQLAELLDEGDTEKLAQVARKVGSFPSRVDSVKKLIDSLRIAVELERKVLRIKDDSVAEDFAKKIGEGMGMSAMESYRALCKAGSGE